VLDEEADLLKTKKCLNKVFGGEKCISGKCLAQCPKDKPYVYRDGTCHICPQGWHEYDGNCHTCPENMKIENGECVCVEGEDFDGTCYLCSEINLVWNKDSRRCVKPKK